jgi:hypothetical protein
MFLFTFVLLVLVPIRTQTVQIICIQTLQVMSNDNIKDFDSIFAIKGNHPAIYINAISQAPSVAVITLFLYFQLTLLSYGYLSLLHKRNGVKQK